MSEYPVVPTPPPAYPPRPPKDAGMAMVLEVLPALFGFYGIGWLYAGQLGMGLALLVGGFVWAGIVMFILAITAGFGCCFTLPVHLAMIVGSAIVLNQHVKGQNKQAYAPPPPQP